MVKIIENCNIPFANYNIKEQMLKIKFKFFGEILAIFFHLDNRRRQVKTRNLKKNVVIACKLKTGSEYLFINSFQGTTRKNWKF